MIDIGLRNAFQELRELGLRGSLFRLGWELRTRTPGAEIADRWYARVTEERLALLRVEPSWIARVPFEMPSRVREYCGPFIEKKELEKLEKIARAAALGKVLCFGKWFADYGRPIDWQLNPWTKARWDIGQHWSQAIRDAPKVGDVKLTWEVARYPQAYHLARAAVFVPAAAEGFSEALEGQLQSFVDGNPYAYGVHWCSGQEMAFRIMAWVFAAAALWRDTGRHGRVLETIARSALLSAAHVERYVAYARNAVYNNHLLSEASLLYVVGHLFPANRCAGRWVEKARSLLDESVARQFYPDGAYIQHSHNYHRLALQVLLWASVFARQFEGAIPEHWRDAMARSVEFLRAQQNPEDGCLPNYGANDGGLPSILTTCDFADFRPILQAVSLMTRGKRLYEPGPWDEEAAWFLGTDGLDAEMSASPRRSVSFARTGYHVLHAREPGTFALFRCGTIEDRFSQIDMLHLDVWWRGQNVLVDGGSYLYNGGADWHNHFQRTESHNTLSVDNTDQMLHYRRFKCLYWTRAKLLDFAEKDHWLLCVGEHYGYTRLDASAVHRRAILLAHHGFFVVADILRGSTPHKARLHWLGGPFPYSCCEKEGALDLDTPRGRFRLSVLDETGTPLSAEVVAGRETPPRGWLSRYYGRKAAVPSFSVEREAAECRFVSLLGQKPSAVEVSGARWHIVVGKSALSFSLSDSGIRDVSTKGT